MEMYKIISQEEAWKLMNQEDPTPVIDVRWPEEFSLGHWPGAQNVQLERIYKEGESFALSHMPDKDKEYIVYCRSGNRSKIACELLYEMGYTHLLEAGGIIDWPYEIVKGN